MKTTYSRRYRRSRSSSMESAMFKKNNQQEQTFFSGPSNESFFKPIMRKCDHCAAEEKKVQKMSDTKEEENKVQKQEEKKEEKPLMKMEEKKEEKPVMKMNEKKEEDKSVQKQDEKKEDDKGVQKMEEKKEEKPIMKMEEKREDKPVMKADEQKEEKPVMKMEEKREDKVSKKEAGSTLSGSGHISSYLKTLNGKGSSLPGEAQQFFKRRMGHDFSHVRIHTGAEAEQSAKDISAKAYAVDNHVVFNKGQYNPDSAEGKKLLAHELTHVVQQKGFGMDVLSRAAESAAARTKGGIKPTASQGRARNAKNQVDFACQGVSVQAQTDANYTDSFSSSGITTPSTKCPDCPDDCVSAKGTIVSVFKANPTVTLPAVPGGLSECESNAVEKFINTTLAKHEQQHVDAFKTYNATIKTPYKYKGCQSGLDAHLQSVHDGINAKRTAAANKKSARLDPFNPKIPCKCDD
ncbi:DUF4157 domain-containing protein [Segetibacter sp. 3557_3]|uniref:eCIS core domain-containing protein n=1 Tax=Segetibacter sp. 3557_3 TaxID=2547429 RepID=UPI00105898CB|nr:DUF4157 domain-containing protein [Segetibacter sp. 3557_3]TDH27274.1 DUF4157 domain-containing protein [Segetibacter sp. 3557_3]